MEDIDLTEIMVPSEAEPEPETAPMPAEPARELALIDTEDEREQLIKKIRDWVLDFPEDLASIKKLKLESMKKPALDAVWKEIDHTLINRPSYDATVDNMIFGVKLAEDITTAFTPIKLTGLHRTLLVPIVRRDLKVIAKLRNWGTETTPEQRIGLGLLQAAMVIHESNTRAEKQAQAKVSPPADEKFDDL